MGFLPFNFALLHESGSQSRREVRGPVQQLRQRDLGRLHDPEESREDRVVRAAGNSSLLQTLR